MTIEEVQKLTDLELRIKAAELEGWKQTMYQSPSQIPADVLFWCRNGMFCQITDLPDYPEDLNACHEMEKELTLNQRPKYWLTLYDIVYDMDGDRSELTGHWQDLKTTGHASARQRIQAFIVTKTNAD